MRCKLISIQASDYDYYFYDAVVEFNGNTISVIGEDVTFTIAFDKVQELKLEKGD